MVKLNLGYELLNKVFVNCRAKAEAQDPPNNLEYNEEEYNNYAAYDGEYGTDYEEGLYGDYGRL